VSGARIYYQDDAVTLWLGDCREVLPTIERVDHVITDPPYEAEAHTTGRRVKRDRGSAVFEEVLSFDPMTPDLRAFVATECARAARRWVITFCQIEAAMVWRAVYEVAGLGYRRSCIWVKPDGQPQLTGDRPGMGYETIVTMHRPGRSKWNGGGRCGVFTHNKTENSLVKAPHPTTKPMALMAQLVGLFTDEGETILDPFAGSGTTLRAAKDLGRRAIGVEREEKWCEAAVRRLAQETLVSARAKPAEQGVMFGDDR
jgi:DNA modification methylase